MFEIVLALRIAVAQSEGCNTTTDSTYMLKRMHDNQRTGPLHCVVSLGCAA
jgi:hypothetical protein